MSDNKLNEKSGKDNGFKYGVTPKIVRLNSIKRSVLTLAERSNRWRDKKRIPKIKLPAKTSTERSRKHRLKYKQLLSKITQYKAQASRGNPSVLTKQSSLNNSHTVPSNDHQGIEPIIIQQPHASQITQCNNIIVQQPHMSNITPNTVKVSHFIRDPKNGQCTQRGKVAIKSNVIDTNVICSRSIDRVLNIDITITSIGDLCSVSCVTEDKKNITIVAIHIFPNQIMDDIIKFMHKKLLVYTKEGSMLLGENLFQSPLILIGEFNISFAKELAHPLLKFFKEKLALETVNISNLTESTSTLETTVDAVFARYSNKIDVKSFISYYNYLEPIIRFSKCDQSDIIVAED